MVGRTLRMARIGMSPNRMVGRPSWKAGTGRETLPEGQER